MTLASAFSTAWSDLKKAATTVAIFLAKNQTNIQTAVVDVGAVVTTIAPSAAPVVTVFDNIESLVMGKLMELANDASQATNLGQLFGTAWPVILGLKAQLANHPAVVAATAAAPAPVVASPAPLSA